MDPHLTIESKLIAAIEQLLEDGSLFPGQVSEVASIARRRWQSLKRRSKAKHPDLDAKIHDLAKALQQHFDPEDLYTGPGEWQHLATVLGEILNKD